MNFDNCKRVLEYYDGASKKYGIKINDDIYMLKYPTKSEQANDLQDSYSNSSFSEYISCHLINALGIDNVTAQETILGTSNNRISVACKDFTSPTKKLVKFNMLQNADINSEVSGRHPILEEVLKTYQQVDIIKDKSFIERFWDTFVIDALLGNFDRHSGNWGFLIDNNTETIINAPIYDCGSCLYPSLSVEKMEQILNDESEIEKRIYVFPKSALKTNTTNEKIDYFTFLKEFKNEDLAKSLDKIAQCYNRMIINNVLDKTPHLSAQQHEFYIKMIEHRYNKIIIPAWKIQTNLYFNISETEYKGKSR